MKKRTSSERIASDLLKCALLNREHAAGCAKDGDYAKAAFFQAEEGRCINELHAMSKASTEMVLSVPELLRLMRSNARIARQ